MASSPHAQQKAAEAPAAAAAPLPLLACEQQQQQQQTRPLSEEEEKQRLQASLASTVKDDDALGEDGGQLGGAGVVKGLHRDAIVESRALALLQRTICACRARGQALPRKKSKP